MGAIHSDRDDDVDDKEDTEEILFENDVAFSYMISAAKREHVLSRDGFTGSATTTCPRSRFPFICAFVTEPSMNKTGDVMEVHLNQSMAMNEALSTICIALFQYLGR